MTRFQSRANRHSEAYLFGQVHPPEACSFPRALALGPWHTVAYRPVLVRVTHRLTLISRRQRQEGPARRSKQQQSPAFLGSSRFLLNFVGLCYGSFLKR